MLSCFSEHSQLEAQQIYTVQLNELTVCTLAKGSHTSKTNEFSYVPVSMAYYTYHPITTTILGADANRYKLKATWAIADLDIATFLEFTIPMITQFQ